VTIGILLVDDQEIVRTGLRVMVETQPDMRVVAEAASGGDAVELTSRLRPQVVLMDIRMPGVDGLEATRRILALNQEPPARVVILTTYDLDEYVYDGLAAGASGFLLKHARPEELLLGIRSAAAGDALVSPAVTRRLISTFADRRRAPARSTRALARLTAREREVLELIAQGHSNREIADQLLVSESTVKTHAARMLTKLDLRDRVQAVVFAYESGIVVPAE
jgi:DNA-binding NarL/FixJ family response regulator